MGFITGVVLPSSEICNLDKEKKLLNKLTMQGERIVVYGQRNTGKTSILKNVIAPKFRKRHKKSLIVFVDLMGVTSFESINERVKISFEEAISKVSPTKKYLQNIVDSFKSFRPVASIDPISGSLSFSIGIDKDDRNISFKSIFEKINEYHADHSALIILDEFQDISFVAEAESRFRAAMQELASDLTIIVSGSKKHLLSNIFSPARAPLAGWGIDVIIPTIESKYYRDCYYNYISSKFESKQLTIDKDSCNFLIDSLYNIPEPVNIVCSFILDRFPPGEVIGREVVSSVINETALARGSRFEEFLSKMTESEQKVVVALAKNWPVISPKSKKFLAKVKTVSPSAVHKIVKRLENSADIYNLSDGYRLSDPLLAKYLELKR